MGASRKAGPAAIPARRMELETVRRVDLEEPKFLSFFRWPQCEEAAKRKCVHMQTAKVLPSLHS